MTKQETLLMRLRDLYKLPEATMSEIGEVARIKGEKNKYYRKILKTFN